MNGLDRWKIELRGWVWLIGLIWILLLFAAGCSLTVPADPRDAGPAPVSVEHAPAEEIWRALVHAVEAHSIETTTRLAQYVTILARNDELSANDVAAFEAAFPSILREERPLTNTDIEILRTLK